MRFHRADQMKKLKSILRSVLQLKKVDSFRAASADDKIKAEWSRREHFAPPEMVSLVLANFDGWLDAYGELSRDHQTFFAGPVGGRAKALYYGTNCSAPPPSRR